MASCRRVVRAPPDILWLRSRRHGTGPASRAGHGRAETRHARAPSLPPGDRVTCCARAGPGPCALPVLRRAAHGVASRSVVQAQDHGPSAAVPAGVSRGSHWGRSLLTCGRPHAPSSQTPCWGPMVVVSRVRRRVAWFMLSLSTAAPSPGAAVVHTTNGCARAAECGAWALGGEPTPGGDALCPRVRTSSGARNPVRGDSVG